MRFLDANDGILSEWQCIYEICYSLKFFLVLDTININGGNGKTSFKITYNLTVKLSDINPIINQPR